MMQKCENENDIELLTFCYFLRTCTWTCRKLGNQSQMFIVETE
jgi:hypothetical protein